MSKRDNAYYLKFLALNHPTVYADYLAGIHQTVAAACQAAGIRRQRTPLQVIVAAWKKATPTERDAFLTLIGAATTTVAVSPSVPAPHTIANPAGTLTDEAKKDLDLIFARRRIKPGEMMLEMGLSSNDQSVRMARVRGHALKFGTIVALELWITRNI